MKIVSSLDVVQSEIGFLNEVKETVENFKRLATPLVKNLAKSKENEDSCAPSRENEDSLAASKENEVSLATSKENEDSLFPEIDVRLVENLATRSFIHERTSFLAKLHLSDLRTILKEKGTAQLTSWLVFQNILTFTNPETQTIFLKDLAQQVKSDWHRFPLGVKMALKFWLDGFILQVSREENLRRLHPEIIDQANRILIQVLKYDWSGKWTNAYDGLVTYAKTHDSELYRENCMVVLMLLSKNVFRFQMKLLKKTDVSTFNRWWEIFQGLCTYALSKTQADFLKKRTLELLNAFLITVTSVKIEKTLLDLLLGLFTSSSYRILVLQCFTQVVRALAYDDLYKEHLNLMHAAVSFYLEHHYIPGEHVALQIEISKHVLEFLTSIYKYHLLMLDLPDDLHGFVCILDITWRFKNAEGFQKICWEFWHTFVLGLLGGRGRGDCIVQEEEEIPEVVLHDGNRYSKGPMDKDFMKELLVLRHKKFDGILTKLLKRMINVMPKPEEFTLVEDENGNLIRETERDPDALEQYEIMRDILIHLAFLDAEKFQDVVTQQITDQLEILNSTSQMHILKSILWAIGSISGAMGEYYLFDTLNGVFSYLLRYFEQGDLEIGFLLYMIGQYPRILVESHAFKTGVRQCIGWIFHGNQAIQDMASATLLNVIQNYKSAFVFERGEETRSFISELLAYFFPRIIDYAPNKNFASHQIRKLYEIFLQMILAEPHDLIKGSYLDELMDVPIKELEKLKDDFCTHHLWYASENFEFVTSELKRIVDILQFFRLVAFVDPFFKVCYPSIYKIVQVIYPIHTECSFADVEDAAFFESTKKHLRSVKKECLKVFDVLLKNCEDEYTIYHFVQYRLSYIVEDFVVDGCISDALSIFATLITRRKDSDRIQGRMRGCMEGLYNGVFKAMKSVLFSGLHADDPSEVGSIADSNPSVPTLTSEVGDIADSDPPLPTLTREVGDIADSDPPLPTSTSEVTESSELELWFQFAVFFHAITGSVSPVPMLTSEVGDIADSDPSVPTLTSEVGNIADSDPSVPTLTKEVGDLADSDPSVPTLTREVGDVADSDPPLPTSTSEVGDVVDSDPPLPTSTSEVGDVADSDPPLPTSTSEVGDVADSDPPLPTLTREQQEKLGASITWMIVQGERDSAERGLQLLLDLLKNTGNSWLDRRILSRLYFKSVLEHLLNCKRQPEPEVFRLGRLEAEVVHQMSRSASFKKIFKDVIYILCPNLSFDEVSGFLEATLGKGFSVFWDRLNDLLQKITWLLEPII